MPRRTLEHDTKKKHPFDLPEQAVVLNVLRSNELFQHRFGQLFREHGLTQPQYNVLRILRGSAPEALPTLEIAARMIEKTPGASRLLDRLEVEGLVHRERCPEDRRRVLCSLTDRALEILEELDEPIAHADRECLAKLSDLEKSQLQDLTSRIAP